MTSESCLWAFCAVVCFVHVGLCLFPLPIGVGDRLPVSILRKSISGRHRPVRVADGPMTARCRFT